VENHRNHLMTHRIKVPANVALGITQRLAQIEELRTTIGLMVQVAAEFEGLQGSLTLVGTEGDTLVLEGPPDGNDH
jgi:hypothetical protein